MPDNGDYQQDGEPVWLPFGSTTIHHKRSRRVLVCGSRTWSDADLIHTVLNAYRATTQRLVVIHGGAKGADDIARGWAILNADEAAEHRADWSKHGKAAGPIRNQEMLDEENPDVVWAFSDGPLAQSKGTADMVRRADKAQIPVYVVEVNRVAEMANRLIEQAATRWAQS